MRAWVVTIAVGAAVAAGVLTAGWSVQAAVLPPPEQGNRIAADAAAWLLRHRLTSSVFSVGGRVRHGLCLHAWFPRRDGTVARGTLLTLNDGARILQEGGPIRVEAAPRAPAREAMLEFELAGCPAVLGTRIASAAQSSTDIRVERAFSGGRPALALRLPTLRHALAGHETYLDRVTLYVSARTRLPIAIRASMGRIAGSGRIWLTRVTPELLRALTMAPRIVPR
jgi:hypothetical protein